MRSFLIFTLVFGALSAPFGVGNDSYVPEVAHGLPAETSQIESLPNFCAQLLSEDADAVLCISKLEVVAPIVIPTATDDSGLLDALKNGVAKMPQTADFGEVGTSFVFGHSSDYFWREGAFKTIFRKLGDLMEGDTVYIRSDKQILEYKIQKQFIVSPNETWVLNQNKNEAMLYLMTCWPVFTALKRLIVTSRLVNVIDLEKIPTSSSSTDQSRLDPEHLRRFSRSASG